MTKKTRFLPIAAFLAIFALTVLISCKKEGEEDMSVSKITINNIPDKINVKDSDPVKSADTFKIYLSASDSQKAEDPALAQATGEVRTKGTQNANGTWSITLDMKKTIADWDGDPDDNDDGTWTGTAKYFSVIISPQDVSEDEADAIWIKASMTALDKDMENCDWEKISYDFRAMPESLYTSLGIAAKAQRLYEVVLLDGAITKPSP